MKRFHFSVLCLLLVAALASADENAQPAGCQYSFELGRQDARQASAMKWFWASWGASTLVGTSMLLYLFYADSSYTSDDDVGMTAFVISGIATLGLSISVPLMVTPRIESQPSESAVDIDCYRRGYIRKTKGRNTIASVAGYAAGSVTVQLIGYVVGMAMLMTTFE